MYSQRFLTPYERAEFLSRHPVIAARAAATKAALTVIGYEELTRPPEWYEIEIGIGLISPSGLAVDDSQYGVVVIQPAPDGEIYFSGWTNARPNIFDLPPYESPEEPGAECDFLCQAGQYKDAAVLVVGALVVAQLVGAFKR